MIGTVIVSVPLGAYMIYSGELWHGILMITLGVLVIANVDNLCRMILMNRVADTHPLIVIFGVILGQLLRDRFDQFTHKLLSVLRR